MTKPVLIRAKLEAPRSGDSGIVELGRLSLCFSDTQLIGISLGERAWVKEGLPTYARKRLNQWHDWQDHERLNDWDFQVKVIKLLDQEMKLHSIRPNALDRRTHT